MDTGMSKVIACANTKGGVGKTTVALSLAECSAYLARRTLVIDLDLQINASTTLVGDRATPWRIGNTVEDYFRARQRDQPTAPMSLITPIDDNLDLLSGKLSIVLFERELLAQGNVPFVAHTSIAAWLDDLLTVLKPHYSLIVFDTPPGLSILAECAIRASDLVVVPQIPDKLSSQGIEVYAKYLIDHLGLSAVAQKTTVLVNMVPARRTNVARRYIDGIVSMAGTGALPYRVFDTRYPDSTVFRGAMEREGRRRFFRWWGTMDNYVIAATRELWRFLGEPLDQSRR
jgi:cellulose biosynthesis protein BcsQ